MLTSLGDGIMILTLGESDWGRLVGILIFLAFAGGSAIFNAIKKAREESQKKAQEAKAHARQMGHIPEERTEEFDPRGEEMDEAQHQLREFADQRRRQLEQMRQGQSAERASAARDRESTPDEYQKNMERKRTNLARDKAAQSAEQARQQQSFQQDEMIRRKRREQVASAARRKEKTDHQRRHETVLGPIAAAREADEVGQDANRITASADRMAQRLNANMVGGMMPITQQWHLAGGVEKINKQIGPAPTTGATLARINAQTLRTAIITQEILAPPIALRENPTMY